MNMSRGLTALLLLFIWQPAWAQLVTVTDKYRVVEVQPDRQRIGIADLDADPKVRQNWVNVEHDTKTYRKVNGEDQEMDKTDLIDSLKPGDIIFVHGGRKWSGKISAKVVGIEEQAGAGGPLLAYQPTTWTGTISEVTDSEVVVEVDPEKYVLLPGGLDYGWDLEPGSPIEVQLPAGEGELVTASKGLATLSTDAGLVQVPVSSLPQDAMVPVLSKSGSAVDLPLSTALKLEETGDGMVLARNFHQVPSESSLEDAGVVLSSGPNSTLVATPDGLIVNLPSTAALVPGQAVQFQGNNVKQIRKWNSYRKGKPKGKKPKGKKAKVKIK